VSDMICATHQQIFWQPSAARVGYLVALSQNQIITRRLPSAPYIFEDTID
jgi:hypothetical protein